MAQTVLITGASGGIGRAAALRFADEGCNLVLAGCKNQEALQLTVKEAEIRGAYAVPFLGDLTDPEICRTLIAFCLESFGVPDILINNAGISHVELFQESTDDHFRKILNTNLSAAVTLTREAVKVMLPKKSGRIINISSVWGLYGASCEVEYSLTKGALNSFTKALAKELAPSGITVNALAPGVIDTEMNAHLSPEEKAALYEEIPAGRAGTPEELAEMIFLLSKAPAYLTGTVIPFDGGWF